MFKYIPHTTRRTFMKSVGAAAATTIAATTLLLGENQLSAHAATSQEEIPSSPKGNGINVLLVHGAFVDASSWSLVIPLLQANGYHVLAVQNPNVSLDEDVNITPSIRFSRSF